MPHGQMRSIRSPYTPLSITRTERSAGTTEVRAASTAAVPEPVKSTALNVRAMPSTRDEALDDTRA